MNNFFLLYKEMLDETRLFNQPAYISNADESGIVLNSKAGKVIIHTISKHAYSEQKAFRNHITIFVYCSASGLTLSPMIIFEKSWPPGLYAQNGQDNCLYAKLPNRYIDEELFMEWFRNIIVPETQNLRPTILLMGGHGPHGANVTNLCLELSTLAKAESIHIILLPPHTTNVLQPLDLCVFRPLKVNLSKPTNGLKLLSITGNYQSLDKTNFTAIFNEALNNTMYLATIKNGFRKTGICPYNPEAINKTRLMPTLPSQSSVHSQSVEITPRQSFKKTTSEVSSN